ncbi:hypothetical protein Vsou_06440 [Vulcanisaeta souniana JCM 11219]|uniref:Uncharacterized protein n=1 Tax=Vulcanisaeta souniana JCM 11219 TaxID=1293586 RepID=A0ABN6SNT7_9CREN|nr:hypothetical protein Vsou_06440 [Vulcanisaeta souniana JCM 11219]
MLRTGLRYVLVSIADPLIIVMCVSVDLGMLIVSIILRLLNHHSLFIFNSSHGNGKTRMPVNQPKAHGLKLTLPHLFNSYGGHRNNR